MTHVGGAVSTASGRLGLLRGPGARPDLARRRRRSLRT